MDQTAVLAEYESHSEKRESILNDLKNIVLASGDPLEGNCFYGNHTLDRWESLYTKQANLFWVGKQGTTRICEIGLNAGHPYGHGCAPVSCGDPHGITGLGRRRVLFGPHVRSENTLHRHVPSRGRLAGAGAYLGAFD